jgi:hypothetical protein
MMKLSEELHRWSFSSEKGLPPLVIHLKHWEEDAAALEAEVARFQETVAAYERLKETLNHGPYRSWQERCEVAESEVARLQALVDAKPPVARQCGCTPVRCRISVGSAGGHLVLHYVGGEFHTTLSTGTCAECGITVSVDAPEAPAAPSAEPAARVTCGCKRYYWNIGSKRWVRIGGPGMARRVTCPDCGHHCWPDGTVTPPAAAPSEEPIKPGPGVADLAKVMREAEAAYAPSQGALSDEALDRLREIARDEIKDHGAGFLYAHDAPEYASARGTLQVDASYPAVGAPPGDPGAEWRRLDEQLRYVTSKRDEVTSSHSPARWSYWDGRADEARTQRDRHPRPICSASARRGSRHD